MHNTKTETNKSTGKTQSVEPKKTEINGGVRGGSTQEKVTFSNGLVSTKQPRLSLIPHRGLINAAKTFEKGIEVHAEAAWNGLKDEVLLEDRQFLIERCSHVIEHAYRMIDLLKQENEERYWKIDEMIKLLLENAGAIAWGGLVLGTVDYRNVVDKG